MEQIRLTIRPNPDDPSDDLRCAAMLRQDLRMHSPVEVDLEDPRHRTRRDEHRVAYFEFDTNYLSEVQRIIKDYGYSERVALTVLRAMPGEQCLNCGQVSVPSLPLVCPKCGFRDIDACPYCRRENARHSYLDAGSNIFKCPACFKRVRMQLNDINEDGTLRQPIVLLEKAIP